MFIPKICLFLQLSLIFIIVNLFEKKFEALYYSKESWPRGPGYDFTPQGCTYLKWSKLNSKYQIGACNL